MSGPAEPAVAAVHPATAPPATVAPTTVPPATTVVEQLADALVALGCDRLFTLMGAGNLWLVHHLDLRHGTPVHHLRHENGAVGAADGLARATGRVGWCTVTQGPGFTNTITALLTADRGRVPMILLVSDTSNLDPQRFPFAGGVQALAPETILGPLGITTVRTSGPDAVQRLYDAHRIATEQSRTVVYVMPAGLDQLPAAAVGPVPGPPPATPMEATGSEIARAASAVLNSRYPVVVAGRGAVAAGARIAELAELLGAPVATTVPASGVLGEHPAVIGPFGGFSIGRTEELVARSDCLIVIGVALDAFQTRKGAFVTGRTIVRIDTDPRPVDGAALTVPLPGDAAAVTERLVAELRDRGAPPRTPEPPLRPEPITDDVSVPGALDPRSLCRRLDPVLPAARRVVVDNGHFGAFPVLYLTHREPRSLIWMPDFGAVGSSLAAAYASAVADPDRTTVLFIGDCGLFMTLGDLETAVRERVPLVVVCLNDGAAGSELVHMKDWGCPPDQAIFGYHDIAALATGMGAQGRSVREVGDEAAAFASWDPARGPLVLDCHISRQVRSPLYDHV
ncbi:thiamine pyrophosphate-dependent acetolactate synthase large subunit-like protein [Pseudonocardia autotrophica]|uniref:Acetolactate synthase isozyme 3 large subunit n=2 Tax=Pseudonocardia TaxID=1847 RepID=A0A1Y2MKL6_PSEAH|nr:Acetolactate synthase isozyme 3 large subunit [Pseudonocardia autotrophica]TDN73110.1 thiamine pyrophosphate-dependent acetolactate synthase large subunit-like protein [Pseudonocardia autotrophica]BBG03830.1 acetolactate synthase [Pseudonocardia autotrophica]GEC27371.1 acetolactate synthase [Pseudonocardia saturnea]